MSAPKAQKSMSSADAESPTGAIEVYDGLDRDCNGVVDDAAILVVEAVRHLAGARGGTRQLPLDGLSVAVYDKASGTCPRAVCGGVSWQHYPCIVSQCPAVAAGVTDLGGEVRLALPAGDYLVIWWRRQRQASRRLRFRHRLRLAGTQAPSATR